MNPLMADRPKGYRETLHNGAVHLFRTGQDLNESDSSMIWRYLSCTNGPVKVIDKAPYFNVGEYIGKEKYCDMCIAIVFERTRLD